MGPCRTQSTRRRSYGLYAAPLPTWGDKFHQRRKLRHLRTLIDSRTTHGREPDPAMIPGNRAGANRMVASRHSGWALLYSPNGIPIEAALDRLEAAVVRVAWFDPRTGSETTAGKHRGDGIRRFVQPTSGRGEDWVLVLKAERD